MKNRTKIMMMILSTLLALVMISSCLVSSTMARYVITKDATTIVSLKKFGVKLTISQGTDFSDSGATIKSGAFGDGSATVSVTVPLVPGSDYDDIVQFVPSIDGEASVATNIKIKAVVSTIDTTKNKYVSGSTTTYYVPGGLNINGQKTTAFMSNTNAGTLKTNFGNDLKTKMTAALGTGAAADGDYIKNSLVAKGDKTVASTKTIKIGAFCPLDISDTNNDTNNKIMTTLADQGATVTVQFYVSLEQADS